MGFPGYGTCFCVNGNTSLWEPPFEFYRNEVQDGFHFSSMVHFFEAFFKARYNIFIIALSFGKDPSAFITLRIERFIDLAAFVVYITLRIY